MRTFLALSIAILFAVPALGHPPGTREVPSIQLQQPTTTQMTMPAQRGSQTIINQPVINDVYVRPVYSTQYHQLPPVYAESEAPRAIPPAMPQSFMPTTAYMPTTAFMPTTTFMPVTAYAVPIYAVPVQSRDYDVSRQSSLEINRGPLGRVRSVSYDNGRGDGFNARFGLFGGVRNIRMSNALPGSSSQFPTR